MKSLPPRGESSTLARWSALAWAALRLRCPRCRTGRMFRGSFAMNDPCPDCGLLFQREEGYFLGAMYFSYLLGALILTPAFFGLSALLPDWDGSLVALLAVGVYLPFVPAVFRYSRLLWVYLDRVVCADDMTVGSYEKMRLREIEENRGDPPDAPR